MKCSQCEIGKCRSDYNYRKRCVGEKEGTKCACKCQVPEIVDAVTKVGSAAIGGLAIGVGVGLAAATGGASLLLACPIIGGGGGFFINPIKKEAMEEHMEIEDLINDVTRVQLQELLLEKLSQYPCQFKLLNNQKVIKSAF